MEKIYVICHMVTSIDGKVTGEFLSCGESSRGTEIYYEINREYKADAYACGRVTMEGSFCGKEFPDLRRYGMCDGVVVGEDYVVDELTGFYAVAFDPKGRLGWKTNHIVDTDEDPGYDKAQIIEVLTNRVKKEYLCYLRDMQIPYIFAGENEIDVELALTKLNKYFGIKRLLLEGGSILDGAFMEKDLIDEISLVVCPIVANTGDKPLFMKSTQSAFKLADIKKYDNNVIWLNYKK